MKNIKILIASIGILLLLWIASWFKLFGLIGSTKLNPTTDSSPTQMVSQKAELTVVFNDGTSVNYQKGIGQEKVTAFSILEEAADKKSLTLDTKKYDFGVFVNSINGEVSSADKAWIYFVNGASGQVAADQYELAPGDKVEWKYVVPEGE